MIDSAQLEEILDVLREKGVSRFSCSEFSVEMFPNAPAGDDDDVGRAIEEAKTSARIPSAARGIFGHPSLWPNGVPPKFPGSERSEPYTIPTHPDEE